MKNKKWLWIIVALVLIIICIAIGIFYKNNKYLYLESHEISDIEKVSIDIPYFTIVVKGLYEGTITNSDLKEKNIQVYDFNAGVFNGWSVNTNKYTGVKLNDVLNAMNINDFSEIEFQAPGNLSVSYEKNEISTNTYLIFYRDGEFIRSDEYISLLAVDYDYRYSLENIITIILK